MGKTYTVSSAQDLGKVMHDLREAEGYSKAQMAVQLSCDYYNIDRWKIEGKGFVTSYFSVFNMP